MNNLNEYITREIKNIVRLLDTSNKYRTPLVGFADARNPLFYDLKNIINKEHYLPCDLLEDAKTVVSFFIPFGREIVYNNLKDDITTTEWGYGKKDTDILINSIIVEMKIKLEAIGVKSSINPAKEPFDEVKYFHKWAQKHVAYICGLGNFGINHLLITESGCAGRYGSFVIDTKTDYSSIVNEEYCLYKINKSCGACVKNCPCGALTYHGLDKDKCSKRLDDFSKEHFDGVKSFNACGKCIALPCALKKPKYNFI